MGVKIQLDIDQRTKLIEILLIVGSIIVAFKIPTSMIWLFMFFVLFSIVYYILNLQEEKGPIMGTLSVAISASFVGIIIYNFAVSLISTYLKDFIITFGVVSGVVLGIVLGVISISYYVVFTFIIYKALRPSLR